MTGRRKGALIAAGVLAALGAGGAAIAGAAGGGDDGEGKAITGPALDKASTVALNHAGGGRVTGSELQDEEGYYEIEVTKADGSQVDVHLDSHFKVVDQKGDGGGDRDSSGSG